MRKISGFFIVGIFLIAGICAAYCASGEPELWASVDSQTVHIGDRIRYQLEVSDKEGADVKLARSDDERIGDFEIKESGSRTRKGFFGGKTVMFWYDLAVYNPGKHTIPRIDVKYRPKGAKVWSSAKSNSIEITVDSVLPAAGADDIRDIKGPLGVFAINWFGVIIVMIVLSVVAAAVIIYRKKTSIVPLKLPHESALEELEAIKGLHARGGDIKEYYVGISDCVRRYIERVFKLKAPEMTTEEFLNSLKESVVLSTEQKDPLKDFLTACDMVKFAKYAPTRPEIEAVMTTAVKFVEETKNAHI
jgi:hypothetical protein